MKKTYYRVFPMWEFDKEEQWLNEMAQKGLALTDVRLIGYTFEDTEPGEYQIRMALLEHWPTAPQSREYIEFLEETGAEHVASVTRWAYFRKKTSGGEFTLHSDYSSKIRQLKNVLAIIGIVLALCVYNGFRLFTDYLDGEFVGNLFFAVLFAVFSMLLIWGFVRIFRKINQLEKDHELFE